MKRNQQIVPLTTAVLVGLLVLVRALAP